jgi:hypothetical protein
MCDQLTDRFHAIVDKDDMPNSGYSETAHISVLDLWDAERMMWHRPAPRQRLRQDSRRRR